ncbi:DUF4296 domain-containing protein [Flavobacterium sp.]|uniref:DUF4296 domain-containing protein n=1 Tax=Flavobacterium sp. TaxID=239 RepID=UPI00286D879B|nr:DUF4296 domain-containing protein [Flavobacterium sp.]
MKPIIILLASLTLLISCSSKTDIPKPDKPIDKAVMENILYDLALLQALKSSNPEKLKKNAINPKTYIYQKYKIDSLQFAQNSKYLAMNTEDYKLIFDRIVKKLENQKTVVDTLIKREAKLKSKRIKDSLTKANKLNKKKSTIISKG